MHKTYLLNGSMKPFNRKPKDLKRNSNTLIPRHNNDTFILRFPLIFSTPHKHILHHLDELQF